MFVSIRSRFFVAVALLFAAVFVVLSAQAGVVTITSNIVSANDIATAITNSTTTSDFMKQNSALFAGIAVNQESQAGSGTSNIGLYNGLCCYGVLQMSTENIAKYGAQYGITSGVAYASSDLQTQIDIYGQYEAAQEKSIAGVMQVAASGTGGTLMADDDGDTTRIDASYIVACTQIGVGYCNAAYKANDCKEAVDGGNVSICEYAINAAEGSVYCTNAAVCTSQGVTASAVSEASSGSGSSTGSGSGSSSSSSSGLSGTTSTTVVSAASQEPSGLSGITGGSSASSSSGSMEVRRLEGTNF